MKMPHIYAYPSSYFVWKKNRGVADASDFGPIGTDIATRIYDDACDVGFYVVSTKTGVKMLFTEFFDDEDGYDGMMRRFSSGDFIIDIFND